MIALHNPCIERKVLANTKKAIDSALLDKDLSAGTREILALASAELARALYTIELTHTATGLALALVDVDGDQVCICEVNWSDAK